MTHRNLKKQLRVRRLFKEVDNMPRPEREKTQRRLEKVIGPLLQSRLQLYPESDFFG